MKPADPHRDYRRLVRDGYDRVSPAFNRERVGQEAGELRPLLDALPPGSSVLDLGCGSGVPVTRALAQWHRVIGVDISSRQLQLAREQVPDAQFVLADMSRCNFNAGAFEAVVSSTRYSICHWSSTPH